MIWFNNEAATARCKELHKQKYALNVLLEGLYNKKVKLANQRAAAKAAAAAQTRSLSLSLSLSLSPPFVCLSASLCFVGCLDF